MNREAIFNQATLSFGGIWSVTLDYLKVQRNRVYSTLKHYGINDGCNEPFPEIIYDFVNNDTLNAFAMQYQEYHIIGIHKGTFMILFDLFNKMLAHPNLFIDIGDVSEEKEFKSAYTDYYSDVQEMLKRGNRGNEYIHPINIERQLYVWHLTTLALDFMFEHELSHIMYGHVDYRRNLLGINEYSEINSIMYKEHLQLDSQTLEMDADCNALSRCCKWAIDTVNHPRINKVPVHVFYKDNYQAISDLFIAIYNTIRIFGDGDYKNMTPGDSTHPNPRVRQIMLLATFEPIIKAWDLNVDHDKLIQLLYLKSVESEKAYQLITGKKVNKEVFDYATENPLVKHLENNWKSSLRRELEEYAFWNLAE